MLAGCDYVINTIEVAGLPNVRHDYDIPLKYGVDQCIGDTIGPGGIFKALRTLPAWLDILADVERLAPRAEVMNYTNPMSITVLTGTVRLRPAHRRPVPLDAGHRPAAGRVSSASRTRRSPSGPRASTTWPGSRSSPATARTCTPLLRERAQDPEIYEQDPVRFEMMFHFGAFVAESSGHSPSTSPTSASARS